MWYCKQCQKNVVVIGLSPGATPEEVAATRRSIEKDGLIALLNPAPFGTHTCPECGTVLEDRAAEQGGR